MTVNLETPKMLDGTCHCGKIRLTVPTRPDSLVLCNCSICRRNGALWAFYDRADMTISGVPEHAVGYEFEPRTITTFHCRDCGCTTHWEPLQAGKTKFGVNMRNFDPDELGDLRLRRFDGAVTWSYLD
jgi:hypothetical protein